MSQPKEQIEQWLQKLEQESWQLELLVSAFTIFLLIGANSAFSDILVDVQYEYDLGGGLISFLYIFLALLSLAIKALIVFLIMHLLLRGFWIGTIGLRSVQSDIDFDKLNYSPYFTEKIQKKVVSLDDMVLRLDQVCSVMFSFAFLIISVLLSFGLFLLFLATVGVTLSSLATAFAEPVTTIISVISAIFVFFILITGFMYLIDYFTLGFFKKFNWVSKWYYPIYRFYGVITLASISRSIYYYLISKFSKKRIRIVYLLAIGIFLLNWMLDFDQYQYYSNKENDLVMLNNQYDDARPADKHIAGVSIPSKIIEGPFLSLFIRYDPRDNEQVKSNCPEMEPSKNDGFNWGIQFSSKGNGGFAITRSDFDDDVEELLGCLASMYEISVNDSVYQDLSFYYYRHPAKRQRGMLSMLSTSSFNQGENMLKIRKVSTDENDELTFSDFTSVPFWFQP